MSRQGALDFGGRRLLAADLAAARALTAGGGARSPATVAGYARACRRWDRWRVERGDPPEDDAILAARIAHLHLRGLAPSTIAYEVAAVRRRARVRGAADPLGREAAAALETVGRAGAGRGRGPSPAMRPEEALCVQLDLLGEAGPALRRVADAAIVGLSAGGLRRAEIAATLAGDVEPAPAGGACVRIRRSKTDQLGTVADWRPIPGPIAGPVLHLAMARMPGQRLIGPSSPSQIGRRFAAAVRRRWSVHGGRRGLAAAMAARGASDAAIMAAGGWRSTVTVAHYAASARAADIAASPVADGEEMARRLGRAG